MDFLLVAGARPNFMKIAPIVHELEARRRAGMEISWRLVHTGQHYDAAMSDVFFDQLRLPPPEINLGVGSGPHGEQTARVLMAFERVLLETPREGAPDWVVVVGDVNSTLACTLAAVKLGIPVAHVEAGLRSFDRSMPEELNRLMTDAVADLLLTPSPDADVNLRREGADETRIRCVGNVMIDTLVEHLPAARQAAAARRRDLGLEGRDYVLVTLHRPSNVDEPAKLRAIVEALRALSERLPVLWPLHPRTRVALEALDLASHRSHPDLRLVAPFAYHDNIGLLDSARLVVTDSGGLQEEATYLRVPCLTLRPNTERPVTVEVGSNRLTCVESLLADADAALAGPPRRGEIPELWDGRTAGRIVDALLSVSAPRPASEAEDAA